MATVVTTATCPLANVKADCNKLIDLLLRGQYPAPILSPGFVQVLQNIAASTDTTSLSTT